MILEGTTFHTDSLASILNALLAVVCMVVFIPRPAQEMREDEFGGFKLMDKAGNTRRFPPYMSEKEIKRLRWLTHCARIINKIDKVQKVSGDLTGVLKEPYETEEDLRSYFQNMRLVGNPITNHKYNV